MDNDLNDAIGRIAISSRKILTLKLSRCRAKCKKFPLMIIALIMLQRCKHQDNHLKSQRVISQINLKQKRDVRLF